MEIINFKLIVNIKINKMNKIIVKRYFKLIIYPLQISIDDFFLFGLIDLEIDLLVGGD